MAGTQIEPALDEAVSMEDFRAAFLAAFGTTELVFAEALFGQILNILHTDPAKPIDAATANFVLALLHRIGPLSAGVFALGEPRCRLKIGLTASSEEQGYRKRHCLFASLACPRVSLDGGSRSQLRVSSAEGRFSPPDLAIVRGIGEVCFGRQLVIRPRLLHEELR